MNNINVDELFIQWKNSGQKRDRDKLFRAFKPTIEQQVGKFRDYPVSDDAVRSMAAKHLTKAINTFDPTRGASLNTHVYNGMRRLNREVGAQQSFVQIPESRRLKITSFQQAQTDLTDRLRRNPSAQELADELSWSVAEVGRMRREMRGEISDTANAGLQEFGQAGYGDMRAQNAMGYVYPELTPVEKQVFEYTFGYGGQPLLKTNREISSRVGISESSVRNIKKRVAEKMMPFMRES